MSRRRVLLVVSLFVFIAHLSASSQWGRFLPVPILVGTSAPVWTWLTANSLLQSLILVFGLAHLFGYRRGELSLFHCRTMWTVAYSILLGFVFLAWFPGLLLFRR
jgi:hypothetical protein